MIVPNPVLHVEAEWRSQSPTATQSHKDHDSSVFDLSQLRLDWMSRGFYLTLDGLALDESESALPALRKYQERRLARRAGVILQLQDFCFNIGRDVIQQGHIFADDLHVPWNPPYFRYFAPFPVTDMQISLQGRGWGLWQLQLVNDATTENGRAQFNGSQRQPVWLGHVTAQVETWEVSAGMGEYDIRHSQWYELRLAHREKAFHFTGNILLHQRRLKIGRDEALDRQEQSWARFVILNGDVLWTVTPDLRVQLRLSQVDLQNSGGPYTGVPEHIRRARDGSLRLSHALPDRGLDIGISLQQRSALVPTDLPQGYEDQAGRAVVLDVHADLSLQEDPTR